MRSHAIRTKASNPTAQHAIATSNHTFDSRPDHFGLTMLAPTVPGTTPRAAARAPNMPQKLTESMAEDLGCPRRLAVTCATSAATGEEARSGSNQAAGDVGPVP